MIKKVFQLKKNATSYNFMLLLMARAKDIGFFDIYPKPVPPYGYGLPLDDDMNTPIGFGNLV